MQNSKLLVLGASGRIGGILRKLWSFEQVTWQTRGKSGGVSSSGWATFDPLADPEALARAASGCGAILCLAGVVPGQVGQGGDLNDNIALAEAAIRASAVSGAGSGARVFLVSSAAVYGATRGVLDENMTLNPVSDYGRAKAEMELRGAALGAELGVQVCALRIGNIAGMDAILGGWKPGFQLDQFVDGRTPRRSYIGVRTLARILGDLVLGDLMLTENLPQALNIAAPGAVEMGALLDAAGLIWAPRPAPPEAIEEVCLSTRALQRFSRLETVSAQTLVKALVEQWQHLQEKD
jgi:nucleoside-diphosphate-sugar epimerase